MSGLSAEDREALALHLWDEGVVRPEALAFQVVDAVFAADITADLIAERIAAALTEAADAIEALLSDPDRRRPLAPDAELATDFANDLQWAAIVVRDRIPPP